MTPEILGVSLKKSAIDDNGMERNKEGKFLPISDPLGKHITYRLRRGEREQLEAIAQARGTTLAELSRVIVSEWIKREGDRT